jgi:hypothetical protein
MIDCFSKVPAAQRQKIKVVRTEPQMPARRKPFDARGNFSGFGHRERMTAQNAAKRPQNGESE